jgi:hypothetical protein
VDPDRAAEFLVITRRRVLEMARAGQINRPSLIAVKQQSVNENVETS